MAVEDQARHPPKWRQLLDALVSVSIVAVCVALTWSILRGSGGVSPNGRPSPSAGARPANQLGRGEPPLPTEPVAIDGAATRGDANARVALIEYSDFQCPYCASFTRETLPKLTEAYIESGRVLLAFRHLPLEALHSSARKAAEAAECAGRQQKFWPMHDLLFQHPKALDAPNLLAYGTQLGIDVVKYRTCLNGEAAARVQGDLQTAEALSISGTPAFLIGTVQPDRRIKVEARLSGAAPFERFQSEFDKLLPSGQGR